jgi:hypothetical protein
MLSTQHHDNQDGANYDPQPDLPHQRMRTRHYDGIVLEPQTPAAIFNAVKAAEEAASWSSPTIRLSGRVYSPDPELDITAARPLQRTWRVM